MTLRNCLLTALALTAGFTACSKKDTPGTDAGTPTPARKTAVSDTATPGLPEAAKLEIVPGILNRDLYIEMKARHNIITARILNDASIKSKMMPLKKAYNALCDEYKVTLSDFNEYDAGITDWGSNDPEAFAALKERIEARRQELMETMPQ